MKYDIRNMNIWRETPEKKKSRNKTDYRDMKIEDLDLSVRSFNSLKRGGCSTVGDILDLLDEEGNGLRRIRNLGTRSETEIKGKLEQISQNGVTIKSTIEIDTSDDCREESDQIGPRIVLRLPRIMWEKEIGEFHLSHYAEDRLRSCGISRVRDLYATHPKNEPGWYAVRELFRKIAEHERI